MNNFNVGIPTQRLSKIVAHEYTFNAKPKHLAEYLITSVTSQRERDKNLLWT